jgi:3-hydroxyisobutyrate dehydrogenase
MDTVGFIGVGKMGGAVAEHIQKAGFPMVVYDTSSAAVKPFVDRGAQAPKTPADVARMSDIIYTALPTPQIVEQVALGKDGILEGIKPGSIYVDISTGGPDLIRAMNAEFRKKDAWAIDAPVSGGMPGAPNGIHEIMVGAPKEIYERLLPVLKAYGDQIIHCGDIGTGSICKLMHQMIGVGMTQAIAEGLTLGVKAGVDLKVVWESVRRGLTGRMHHLHVMVPQSVFPGVYEPSLFTLTLMRKDMGIATALGRQHNVPLPVSNYCEQVLIEGINRGWGAGSGYVAAIFPLQEEAAGVQLRLEGIDPVESEKFLSSHPKSVVVEI